MTYITDLGSGVNVCLCFFLPDGKVLGISTMICVETVLGLCNIFCSSQSVFFFEFRLICSPIVVAIVSFSVLMY